MKNYRFILVITLLVFASSICLADTIGHVKLNSKINLSSPNAVADRANKGNNVDSSSPFDEIKQNPFVNGYFNSITNMMQGATGGSFNPQEQNKQQTDYVKQQMNSSCDE